MFGGLSLFVAGLVDTGPRQTYSVFTMNAATHTNPAAPLTTAQGAFLSKVLALRTKAFAFRTEIGADFARVVKRNWKDSGCEGLRTACWILSEEVKDVEGAWDIHVAARDLACAA